MGISENIGITFKTKGSGPLAISSGDGETIISKIAFDSGSDRIVTVNNAGILKNFEFSSINTVGTLTSGEWRADTIQSQHGGTGQTYFAPGRILYGKGNNNPLDSDELFK
jgi:hypothetical protein